MELIECSWLAEQDKYQHFWLADDESKIAADFDPDSAVGSMILVIATKALFVKNCKGEWQRSGTTEVVT